MGLRSKLQALVVMMVLAGGASVASPGAAWATGVAPAPAYTTFTGSSATITAGTTLVTGSNCDDCVVTTSLPFDFTYMGVTHPAGSTIYIGTNGTLSFDTAFPSTDFSSACPLPDPNHGAALFPLWEDLDSGKASSPTEGIFTVVTGTAPSRRFSIEWRTQLHSGGSAGDVHFEVQLAETTGQIEYLYQAVDGSGTSAAVGIQQASTAGAATLTSECHTGGIAAPHSVTFNPTRPSIDGVLEEGQTLTAAANGFSGSPAPTVTYQWQRCDSAGNTSTCADIPSATEDHFTLGSADLGNTVRLETIATNASGSASAFSLPSEDVKPEPPPAPLYTFSQGTTSYIAGVTNVGNSGDDVESTINFPFPVTLYGQQYTTGFVGSNGSLGLGPLSDVESNSDSCLPSAGLLGDVIAAYQFDQRTDQPGTGVFSRVLGTAPHRTFVLDWRTVYYADHTQTARYEILLREDSPVVSVVFGAVDPTTYGVASGVQQDPGGPATQFFCGSDLGASGGKPGTIVNYAPSQPLLSAGARQGQPITFKSAMFSGSPTLKAQWERCNSQGAACADITGATGASYTPGVPDVGHTLRVRQIASNGFGSGQSESQPSHVIAPLIAKLTGLRIRPASFRAATTGGSIARASGTNVGFTLNRVATVRFTISRVRNGKRTPLKGSFPYLGKAGKSSLRFTGRLGGHTLKAGSYVLFAHPSADGRPGAMRSAAFKIVP